MPFLPSPSLGHLPHSLLPLVYACDALSKYIYRDGNVYVFGRNVNVFPLINAAGVSSTITGLVHFTLFFNNDHSSSVNSTLSA